MSSLVCIRLAHAQTQDDRSCCFIGALNHVTGHPGLDERVRLGLALLWLMIECRSHFTTIVIPYKL